MIHHKPAAMHALIDQFGEIVATERTDFALLNRYCSEMFDQGWRIVPCEVQLMRVPTDLFVIIPIGQHAEL